MSLICKRLFSYGRFLQKNIYGLIPQNKNNLDFKNINVFVLNDSCPGIIHKFGGEEEKIKRDELLELSNKPLFIDYNTVNYTIIDMIKYQNQEFYTAPLPSRPTLQ